MSARNKALDHIIHLAIFAMLGVIMYISDILMEFLPNVHIVGVLVVVYTVVYRSRALLPIYIYVLMNGLFSGFGIWWLGYLYIWTVLWGLVMLVPKRLPEKARYVIYTVLCTLHGFAFGLLYLPVQTIYSSDINYLISWWSLGFVTADIYHGIGNCIFGILLIFPLSKLLLKLENKIKVV